METKPETKRRGPGPTRANEHHAANRQTLTVDGLARIEELELVSRSATLKLLSGHVLGQIYLDKEQLGSLRMLAEYWGICGPTHKKAEEEPSKPEGFKVT